MPDASESVLAAGKDTSRRWLFYGDLLSNHACVSLENALRRRGQEVFNVPRHEGIYRIRSTPEEYAIASRLVQEAVERHDINVLFNYRSAELPPATLKWLRDRGVKTFTWFQDDPLTYQVITRHAADHYDYTLHTGAADVLDLYERNQQTDTTTARFSFPFWTDREHFPYSFDPEHAKYQIGFLGHLNNIRKRDRYALLASLPFSSVMYGRLTRSTDYASIHGGQIFDYSLLPKALSTMQIALSIAQTFVGIEHDQFYYPEVESFREFFFPSRISQYAAAGMPIISKSERTIPIPSVITVASRGELIEQAGYLLADPQRLLDKSQQTSLDFDKYLSADKRAEMLLRILDNPSANLSIDDRADFWRLDEAAFAEPAPRSATLVSWPSIDHQRDQLAPVQITATEKYRILYISRRATAGASTMASIQDTLKGLGHAVYVLDPSLNPEILIEPSSRDTAFRASEINLRHIFPIITAFRPDMIFMDASEYCFSARDIPKVKRSGCVVVGINLTDCAGIHSSLKYALRFDYLTTNSLDTFIWFHKKGRNYVIFMPPAVDHHFAAAHVAVPEALQSRIICLGQGNPERQAFVSDLKERYGDSRIFGSGWKELPITRANRRTTALVARGANLTIHLADCLTSPTSTGLGQLDAIAHGSLLITKKTPELDTLFDYDTELLGFDTLIQARGLAEYYLEHSDEAESILRRAFQRLSSHHLWEHRLEDLLATIRSDLSEQLLLHPTRYSTIRVAPQSKAAKRVVCFLDFEEEDPASVEQFRSIVDNISQAIPEAYIETITHTSGRNCHRHGFSTVSSRDLTRVSELLPGSVGLVFLPRPYDQSTQPNYTTHPESPNTENQHSAELAAIAAIAHSKLVPVLYYDQASGAFVKVDRNLFATSIPAASVLPPNHFSTAISSLIQLIHQQDPVHLDLPASFAQIISNENTAAFDTVLLRQRFQATVDGLDTEVQALSSQLEAARQRLQRIEAANRTRFSSRLARVIQDPRKLLTIPQRIRRRLIRR